MSRLIAAIAVLVLAVALPATAQDEEGITPADVVAPADIDPDILSGYIVPLDVDIRPLVATISQPDIGIRESTGGEQAVIALDADVFFDFDSDVVKPEARTTLTDLVGQLEGITQVEVTGHTDNVGEDDYNLDLSARRAESVAAVLAELRPDLVATTAGRGESEPVAPNETEDGEDIPEGRALNRRVEIRYTPS